MTCTRFDVLLASLAAGVAGAAAAVTRPAGVVGATVDVAGALSAMFDLEAAKRETGVGMERNCLR